MRPATTPNAPSPPPRTALPRRASAARGARYDVGSSAAADCSLWDASSMEGQQHCLNSRTNRQTNKQTNGQAKSQEVRARRDVSFPFWFPAPRAPRGQSISTPIRAVPAQLIGAKVAAPAACSFGGSLPLARTCTSHCSLFLSLWLSRSPSHSGHPAADTKLSERSPLASVTRRLRGLRRRRPRPRWFVCLSAFSANGELEVQGNSGTANIVGSFSIVFIIFQQFL